MPNETTHGRECLAEVPESVGPNGTAVAERPLLCVSRRGVLPLLGSGLAVSAFSIAPEIAPSDSDYRHPGAAREPSPGALARRSALSPVTELRRRGPENVSAAHAGQTCCLSRALSVQTPLDLSPTQRCECAAFRNDIDSSGI